MIKLSDNAREILNDPARIRARDDWFQILGDLFDGRRNPYLDGHVMTLMGTAAQPNDPWIAYSDPERWVVECLENLAAQLAAKSPADRFAPACIEFPIYGVHFIDRILGAEVFFQDGQWYAHNLPGEVGSLSTPDIERNETWALAKRAALAFLEQDVALPLFGMPTLSSALNTFVNLYRDEALIATLESPEAAARDLRVINDAIMAIHRWYLNTLPSGQLQGVISWCRTQPPGHGQLCGCSMHLVSGDMYRALAAPLDEELLGLYPNGGMIHLCGSHAQHVQTFREMESLKAVQLNDRAAQDLKVYFEELRQDQIIYLNPCEEMPIDRALEITAGARLVVCGAVSAPKKPPRRGE